MLIGWKEEFNLGVELFDSYHRRLVEMLNSAHDKLVQNPGSAAVESAIEELFDYANQHFCAEEKYMEENSYAGYVEHLDLHKSYFTQAEVMRKDLKEVWRELPREKLFFLKTWLLHDILVTDSDYARQSAARPPRRSA